MTENEMIRRLAATCRAALAHLNGTANVFSARDPHAIRQRLANVIKESEAFVDPPIPGSITTLDLMGSAVVENRTNG